jgi:hypothetical protein
MGILDGRATGGKEVIINTSQRGMDDDGDNSISKKDLDRFRKQMQADKQREDSKESFLQAGRKGFNAVRHGLNDVAKSLNAPDSKKRPKIARIPNLRHADINTTINLDKMKHPDLLGRDIRGKRVKPD